MRLRLSIALVLIIFCLGCSQAEEILPKTIFLKSPTNDGYWGYYPVTGAYAGFDENGYAQADGTDKVDNLEKLAAKMVKAGWTKINDQDLPDNVKLHITRFIRYNWAEK